MRRHVVGRSSTFAGHGCATPSTRSTPLLRCIEKLAVIVDPAADAMVEDRLDIARCPDCSHWFELTGLDGIIVHTSETHAESLLAAVAKVATSKGPL